MPSPTGFLELCNTIVTIKTRLNNDSKESLESLVKEILS